MRVLTWNLFHGRAVPDRPRELLPEFADLLSSWDWDVALLQEVPPWWPRPLAQACGASMRMALTSRNELLPLRRVLAQWRPDVLKSNGGGSNAILVRGARITEHRAAKLRWWPERRVVHALRIADGTWIANLHAQKEPHHLTRADLRKAGSLVTGWAAGGAPIVLGGDCNVPDPEVPGLAHLGGFGVDHVLGRGLEAAGRRELPDRRGLSDHAAVLLSVRPAGRSPEA